MNVNSFNAALNAALFVMLLVVVTMFARYILRQWLTEGRSLRSARVQAATAISVLVFGDAILRGWFWYWRAVLNGGAGDDYRWLHLVPVPSIGFIVQFVGAVCVIRVFSPDDWTRYAWVLLALVAIAIGASVMAMF